MKSSRFWLALSAFALVAGGASANDELIKLSKDPNQWVMPTGQLREHALQRARPDQHSTTSRI